MAHERVIYEELTPETKPEDLAYRYYGPSDLAKLLNVNYYTVVRHIKEGKINGKKNYSGRFQIPREEVVRLLGGDVEDKRYLHYDGIKVPHMYYLMYLMIETANDLDEISQRLNAFRLPHLPPSHMHQLWEGIICTAPPRVRRAMRDKRRVTGVTGFVTWTESLGIYPLFNYLSLPCRDILMDHSRARVATEALIGGRVALDEISEFVERRWGRVYNVDSLKFFQHYFYNVLEFNYTDYCKYLRLIQGDEEEVGLKRKAWDDPNAAKITTGIPQRADIERDLNMAFQVATMQLSRYIDKAHQDPTELKIIIDSLRKAQDGIHKQQKMDADEMASAMAEAADSENIVIEKPDEEPVCFDELEQPALTEKEIKEGTFHAG